DQRNAFRRKARIVPGIANQQRLSLVDHPLACRRRGHLFLRLEAELRLEPKSAEIHPPNVGVVGRAQHRGQLRQLIERRVGVAIEDVEVRTRNHPLEFSGLLALYGTHVDTLTQLSVSGNWMVLTLTQIG